MKHTSWSSDGELHARLNAFLQADAESEMADEDTIRYEVQQLTGRLPAGAGDEPAHAGGQRVTDRRTKPWRLPRHWLAVGGCLGAVLAAVALVAALSSAGTLIFVLGALLGVLAGGTLCAHYLRTAIAADIGPQLRRMHVDIDPKLRRMQNQLDGIESAVNLALATWHAELSDNPSDLPGQGPHQHQPQPPGP